jgi:hypothetical protein
MDREIEQLFVRRVDIGVANMDVSADDGFLSTRVVVERVDAADRQTGEDRELLLIYGAQEVQAVASALREASERATSAQA